MNMLGWTRCGAPEGWHGTWMRTLKSSCRRSCHIPCRSMNLRCSGHFGTTATGRSLNRQELIPVFTCTFAASHAKRWIASSLRDRLWSSEPAARGGPRENTVSAGGYAQTDITSSLPGQDLVPQKSEALMLDLFFIAVAAAFFIGCWYLTRACERL